METTTITALADWLGLAGNLFRMGPFAGLAMALVLGTLLTVVFEPRPASDADLRPEAGAVPASGRPAAVAVAAVSSAAGPPARLVIDRRPGPAAYRSSGERLSPAELPVLESFRRRVLADEVAEELAPSDRLIFARWLVEHGRLSG